MSERLTDAYPDEEVLNSIVSRYGQFVLLKPRLSVRTVLLWGASILLIVAGAISLLVFATRRAVKPSGSRLRVDDRARLNSLERGPIGHPDRV